MKNWKKRGCCLFLCLTLVLSGSLIVWAQEATADTVQEEVLSPEKLDAESAKTLIEAVAKHLTIYARYDTTTERSLYQAAIGKLLENNPDLYTDILKGMLESLDSYSEYYTAEEGEDLMTSVSGEIVGIGVTLDFSDSTHARIVSVIPDTPAERAGLQVGDVIVSADGVDLRGAKSEIVLSNVRGEEGSAVRLEIERDGAVLTFEMVREKIIGTSIDYEIVENNKQRVMYIRVYGFVSNTAEKFREAIDKANEEGIINLMIDMRDNGGGMLDQAIYMAENFVTEEQIITTSDSKIDLLDQVYYGKAAKSQKFNTVILTNEYTASAAEVFTAALQENELAHTIGTNTYGKGTIQSINSLANGGMIKYTSGFYLTPKGNNINGVGLSPGDYVENTMHPVDASQFGDFQYTRVYRVGDTGEEIRTAKEILSFYGLYLGEINDVFDEELYYAIFAFQTQAQVYPYGVMDITTQIQLHNYLDIVKVEQDDQLRAAYAYFGMEMPEE